jgi:DNA (cytosine-5)-methyltransferase 1
MKVLAVDFFCDAGGLTRGLLDAGVDVALGIDIDRSAKKTYEKNNRVPFVEADLRKFSPMELQDALSSYNLDNTALMFVGCAPCQPFSNLNHQRNNDFKSEDLLSLFGDFIAHFLPRFIFAENVPQMAKRHVFLSFAARLASLGYIADAKIADLCHYGLPQRRSRLLLLGAHLQEVKLPTKNYRIPTVREKIAAYPPIAAGEKHPTVPNHSAAKLEALNLERLEHTPPSGGDARSWPEPLKLPSRRGSNYYYDVYGRMVWDAPAPTLTTRCNILSSGRFGHPEQPRAISLREAAALQSFRDNYIFEGTDKAIARHIGNSVPPLVGKMIGETVLDHATASCGPGRGERAIWTNGYL